MEIKEAKIFQINLDEDELFMLRDILGFIPEETLELEINSEEKEFVVKLNNEINTIIG